MHLLQLVAGHTVIIVGYIIWVGTSLLTGGTGGEFWEVGVESVEAEMENLLDPQFSGNLN